MSDIVSANQDENNTNLIQNKKSRGRPKLTEDEKQKRKEELKAYHKEYKIKNKNEVKILNTKYYENNKDDIIKKNKEYYNQNRDKYIEKAKYYNELKKDKYQILNLLLDAYLEQKYIITDTEVSEKINNVLQTIKI